MSTTNPLANFNAFIESLVKTNTSWVTIEQYYKSNGMQKSYIDDVFAKFVLDIITVTSTEIEARLPKETAEQIKIVDPNSAINSYSQIIEKSIPKEQLVEIYKASVEAVGKLYLLRLNLPAN